MANPPSTGLLAIDVGNSRLKLAWYAPQGSRSAPLPVDSFPARPLPIVAPGLPMPDDRLELEGGTGGKPLDEERLNQWLKMLPLSSARCLIASVQQTRLGKLLDVLASGQFADRGISPHVLRPDDLPIAIRTDQPEQVGIDRLLNGVAANHLRQPERAAIIVDLGSAITVDRVAVDGAFEGGAILPGLAMSAGALQTGTDLLPRILPGKTGSQPSAVGKNTSSAIAAGLYWGAIGAVHELVRQQSSQEDLPYELFITGGDALRIAGGLQIGGGPVHYQEQMVLAGIWLAARE